MSLIDKLDSRKAMGPDGISALFLKEVASEIAQPLAVIYNKSLETGVIPSAWKKSNVTPVHKSGSFDDPSNYRPISVVPIVAKLLEKIVSSQLSAHLESHCLLSDYQGAYRKSKSTEQLLMVAVNSIIRAIDSKQLTCVAFLDLRKAFDSLDHVILLERLCKLGVHDIELSWFTNYLSDRFQRVKNADKFSDWGLVHGGIPQGSALGPLLFLVYMNDMAQHVKHGTLLQFADDTALICSGGDCYDVHRQISEDLLTVSNWIASSKMRLNVSKSNVMWFTPASLQTVCFPPVLIGDTPLQRVTVQKYLGILIDENLTWTAQVSHVSKMMSYYLFWINSKRKFLSSVVIKLLIDSLVLSRLDYALPVWGPPLTQASINRLQRLQNWGVRITKSLHKYDHVSHHLNSLSWLPVNFQIQYRSLCAMHRHYLGDAIPFVPPITFGVHHSHNTRCPSSFANLPRCRLSFTQHFFHYRTAKWWNQIPLDIVSQSRSHFPSALYSYLLNK